MGYSSMTKEELQNELNAWNQDLKSTERYISWLEQNAPEDVREYQKELAEITSEISKINSYL
ncbi:hypothetical protein [Risungbinella massiliensis]|uniref:hypothetical protein n=1 Tax=Risungbinella massiliensis TaxID=1329796 RepID=UPI0005CC0A7B|nr:hypothetical protein [Risungbinella massiliensis]